MFQIAMRMSPTCASWRSNLPSLCLGDSTWAGPRWRTLFSVRAAFPSQHILLTVSVCDYAACRQARRMGTCREIPPQASNYISIIHRCCNLVIVPHTICAVVQCLHDLHLRLEFGTELVQGSTAHRRCISAYCSALRLDFQTSARIILQPAKPPINRCLRVQRIRLCQIAYQPRGTWRSGHSAAKGGHPMWSTRCAVQILFVHHCTQVLYLCSGRPVMCYLRIFLNLVAAVRVDLPILRTAYHQPISLPMPLLTQSSPDDHVPEMSRHVHGSSPLVLCQAYTI